jgi:hypothetical protein
MEADIFNRAMDKIDNYDKLIQEYEKHIEGYKQLVEASNIRIRKLEEENSDLKSRLDAFEDDVVRMYRNHCRG